MTATPDYLVATREAPDPWRTPGVLEIKNAGEYTRGQWVEEPPLPYLVQLQAQILVSGFAWGVLAALLGGADLVFRDYVAHEGVAEWIVEDVAAFWACVQRGDPPRPLDGDAATTRALARLYPRPVPEKTIALPPAAAEWDRIIHDGDAEIKAITERVDAARNELRAAIGDAERGTLPDGSSWSYKLESRPEYTVHARELRVLRHGKRR